MIILGCHGEWQQSMYVYSLPLSLASYVGEVEGDLQPGRAGGTCSRGGRGGPAAGEGEGGLQLGRVRGGLP